MAFPNHPQSTSFVAITPRDYDDFPSLPDEFVAKFPMLREYQAAQQSAWQVLKANLRSLEANLEALQNKVNSPP